MYSSLDDSAFNALCEKIATGTATPEEMRIAFTSLSADINTFSQDIKAQLQKIS